MARKDVTAERRPRRVSATAATLGALVAVLVVTLVVVALEGLMAAGERSPADEAPAEPLDAAVDLVDGDCPTDPVPPTRQPEARQATADLLIECPRLLHGQRVIYRGEAVRAVLERGAHAWLQVNDDAYALERGPVSEHRTAVGGNSGIAVRIPRDRAELIETVGDARHHGTIVEVTGTWLVDGAGDGGGPGIRADDVTVLREGRQTQPASDHLRAIVAAVMTALAALTSLLTYIRRRTL